ncbi:c-type cytochrome [Azohydromonas sediminis]|uniref:c-type cytochrome n=1 Tax=Azohydromonas sediminis TaxID=2259674 RepID=UPI000E658BD7|nr:c-type cytochrome [Azohydromonas sediminis]
MLPTLRLCAPALVGLVVLMALPTAHAVDAAKATELAKAKACMSCHAVDRKLVGPAYKDVAEKYKADKEAPAKLAQKILKGGSGVWGPVPMPATAGLAESDALLLAQWVLAGAPSK